MNAQARDTGRPVIDWFDQPYVLRDVDGDKIGDIVEVNPDFIVAETDGGFLGLGEHRRYFIPRSHVSGDEGSDWRVSVDKDQLDQMNWSNPPSSSNFATNDWQQQYGYTDEEAGMTAGAGATYGGADDAGGAEVEGSRRMRMIRFEEDLQAQTVQRQAGEVTIRKDVVEEVATVEVPVRREEVHVERRPVTDQGAVGAADYAGSDQPFTGGSETITVPVMEEEVEVRKVARPVEEVVVSKDTTEETRRVSDTVRREEFDIEGDEGVTAVPGDQGLTGRR